MSTITIEDILLMEQIIRFAQKRGSFDVSEMVPVGQLHVKLTAIIEQAKKGAEKSQKLDTIHEEKTD